ncbi:MAG: hypothetical protein ACOZF2_03785 [Thermodesulfobacteriota bacterium]
MLTSKTDLPRLLKRERGQKKDKQPFQPSLFVRIHALVQKYGLGDDFLSKIDEFTNNFPSAKLASKGAMVKENLQLPLFALASLEKYRLAMAIIDKVNNPYLHFAHSPEEILWCIPLFQRHPHLEPGKLGAHHFQTLLSGDLAGEKPETSKRA